MHHIPVITIVDNAIPIITIDDDDDDSLRLDSSYQRATVNTIHGETIRIPMVVFPNSIEQNVQHISNIEIPYLNKNHYFEEKAKNKSMECSVCFCDFSSAFRPGCSFQTCEGIWYCKNCLIKYFNSNETFFAKCTQCQTLMYSMFDDQGKEVDTFQLLLKCTPFS